MANVPRNLIEKLKSPEGIFLSFSSFVTIVSILVLGGMLLTPSEPGNAVFIGLSLPRLMFALGMLIVSGIFMWITIRAWRDRRWADEILERWFGRSRFSRGVAWLAAISFGLGWIGSFLPAYRLGALAGYWLRIRPAMIFILLASLAALAVIYIRRGNFSMRDSGSSQTFRLSLILFCGSLVLLAVLLFSRFGFYSPEDYWYGAGVPLLASQLVFSLCGGLLFLHFEEKWDLKRWDYFVALLIYACTAILWMREPLHRSFFFTPPYPPNRAYYPFSDAALFDSASQFALIGQRILIENGLFFERPLYLSFLVYLHSLWGQNYSVLTAMQAGIFAVLPALVYLIGKSLHVRAIGFGAALIALLRGINAIAGSNMIDLAGPKMLLTDFPAAIGVALLILLMCKWLKEPSERWHYALWTGGTVGASIMLRTNALVFLPLVPLYALFGFLPRWRRWLFSSLFFILAIFAITLPWELRNQSVGGIMYSSFFTKFENVFKERYAPLYDNTPEPNGFRPNRQGLSIAAYKSVQSIFVLLPNSNDRQVTRPCQSVLCFSANHFLHNITTSILILQTSHMLDDLRGMTRGRNPYWQPRWDGSFTFPTLCVFILNIFFIVLGISLAWNQHRMVGIIPLAIFFFYDVSNAFARTSGGRYVVPIDWIISIYFLLGVFQVIVWTGGFLGIEWKLFSEPSPPSAASYNSRARNVTIAAVILIFLFGLGSLIPLSEKLYAPRFPNFDFTKTLVDHKSAITDAGLNMKEIDVFLKKNKDAELLVGRALYTRFYNPDKGEVYYYPYVTMGFPRMAFELIGPRGQEGVVLPGDLHDYFPHGADVLVLGCREEKYIDAAAVILLGEQSAVYVRAPHAPLQCPLRQPICNSNHVCQ